MLPQFGRSCWGYIEIKAMKKYVNKIFLFLFLFCGSCSTEFTTDLKDQKCFKDEKETICKEDSPKDWDQIYLGRKK